MAQSADSVGAFFAFNRAISYEMPFRETITQASRVCDAVVCVTDPRMDDGTPEALDALATALPNVTAHAIECDWDTPNPLGAWKTAARRLLVTDWCLEADPFWWLPDNTMEAVARAASSAAPNVLCIAAGSINLFAGDNVKHAHPKTLPILSRNHDTIAHNGRERRGCGLVLPSGASLRHSLTLGPDWSAGLPPALDDPAAWYVLNYEYYDPIVQYEMARYHHYIEGRLDTPPRYEGVSDYTQDLDGNPVSFWDPHFRSDRLSYVQAIDDEMTAPSIEPVGIQHPDAMREWVALHERPVARLPHRSRRAWWSKLRRAHAH